MYKNLKSLPLITLSFALGAVVSMGTTLALAHGGDNALIHACVKNGSLRIVGANDTCNTNETTLDWNIQGVPGPTGTPGTGTASFINCDECSLADVQLRYNVSSTTNHNFDKALLDRFNAPVNTDFAGSSFMYARIRGASFVGTNLSNTNWSNANVSAWLSDNGAIGLSNFNNSNLTSAIFSNTNLTFASLTSTNLTNANFSNANLRFADLTGANTTNTNFTGAAWRRATCPDGTILEDEEGVTCEGHLNP